MQINYLNVFLSLLRLLNSIKLRSFSVTDNYSLQILDLQCRNSFILQSKPYIIQQQVVLVIVSLWDAIYLCMNQGTHAPLGKSANVSRIATLNVFRITSTHKIKNLTLFFAKTKELTNYTKEVYTKFTRYETLYVFIYQHLFVK